MIGYIFFCLLTLFSIVPHDITLVDHVDLVEVNHFYDEHGKLVFNQDIFFNWDNNVKITKQFGSDPIYDRMLVFDKMLNNPRDDIPIFPIESKDQYGSRHNVVAWRLIKYESQIPYYDYNLQCYVTRWNEGENGKWRTVYSKSIREDWKQYDIELIEREILPKEKRKELKETNLRKVK
jgi:hypothetical protein